jgi:molecular chaperone DnaK
MADYHKVIGIDLGTTFSVVSAYALGKGEVVVIPNQHNQRTTPSVVYVSKTGQTTVGEAARKQLEKDPAGVVIEAKRLMGEWEIEGKTKKMISLPGRPPLEPEFVSALILKELKACAEKYIGEPINDAVITVPAYFKESQKNATMEAARLARLNPRLLVNEPTAAAVAYGLDEQEDSTYIVYDFGGGTFDVSVVRLRNGRQFDILGTGGDAHLGGGDIDQAIIDWALSNIRRDHGRDFGADLKLIGRMRREAERVKIDLCNTESEQEFSLSFVAPDIEQVSYFLSPNEFKRLIRPLLDKTVAQVKIAMESAAKGHQLTWDEIDAFVMVGGSSKIPYVREMLTEQFKKPIRANLNPDEIVSIGATRLALDFTPSLAAELFDKELVLDVKAVVPDSVNRADIKDVVSHTLGIGLKGDVYDPLIPKDTVIPHTVTRKGYTTAEDNQTSVAISVYQGDNPKASANYSLGEVIVDGLTPAPVGTHRFEVTFKLDASGVFDGEVLHNQTGVRKEIKLQRGQDGLVGKKRIELADAVASGTVNMANAGSNGSSTSPGAGTAGQKPDYVSTLLAQAQIALDALPASGQAELTAAIARLAMAQAQNLPTHQPVLDITMIMQKYANR